MVGSRNTVVGLVAIALVSLAVGSVQAQEDAEGMGPSFKEGDIITFEQVEALKPYVPEEFWANRDFFLYEGMQLEIGPFYRDYSPPEAYKAATEKYRGQSKIGPDGSLENYVTGRPFPMDEIDCTGDPQAALKIMWNFDYTWNGAGGTTDFYYSYWDRGEELPLYYEGTSKSVMLSHRIEPQYEKTQGDVFRNE
ncbi:MAG: DUF1329 domain-containing protein, partial [Deltaproteobacteria bacterium]|nr:DUF1329 domain-containing protein [Deltaproteobacteria bacterium]